MSGSRLHAASSLALLSLLAGCDDAGRVKSAPQKDAPAVTPPAAPPNAAPVINTAYRSDTVSPVDTAYRANAASPVDGAAPAGAAPPSAVAYIGDPVPNLSPQQLAAWRRGEALFTKVFAVTDGIGPEHNNVQCAACHYLPNVGGGGDVDHGLRLTSIPGAKHLGVWMRHAMPGQPDPVKPPNARIVPMRPPPLYGVAQFDRLTDAEISAGCDPDDRDHDGVRGHPGVHDGLIGRFGHQLTQATLVDMVSHAALEEMGLTNPGPGALNRTRDLDAVPDPEMKMEDVNALVDYVRGLAPPPRAGNDPQGEKVFARVGCATCHKPDLAGKVIGAYTDLCVHDIGPAFETGVNEVNYSVLSSEVRTTPLWGLRSRKTFFHDDQAKTLDEAIRAHAGEAKGARDRYRALSSSDRGALLRFLSTL